MDRDDEKVEAYLRQFRARRPGPLPRTSASRRWPLLVAAAIVVSALGGVLALWRARPARPTAVVSEQSATAVGLTAGRVSRLTGWDADTLDRALLDASGRTLPDVERSEGALRVLASLGASLGASRGNGAQQP